jgi:hypothetical protein
VLRNFGGVAHGAPRLGATALTAGVFTPQNFYTSQMDASNEDAISKANAKLGRLKKAGLRLSENDRKVVTQGQLMTTLAPLGAKVKETGRAFGKLASDVKVAS